MGNSIITGGNIAVGNQGGGSLDRNSGNGVKSSDSLQPLRKKPRNLSKSEHSVKKDKNGVLTYNSPIEMGKYLYSEQGSADKDFQGTCGLCSCANILRLAGVNVGEKKAIKVASKKALCSVGSPFSYLNGATSPRDRQKILGNFGIKSSLRAVYMDEKGVAHKDMIKEIAGYIESGKGVIASVHAEYFYYGIESSSDYHAVTVTSFTKNELGEITGFFVADSNFGTSFYQAEVFQKALTGNDLNVTDVIIR